MHGWFNKAKQLLRHGILGTMLAVAWLAPSAHAAMGSAFTFVDSQNGAIQFNKNGLLGGTTDFTYSTTTRNLAVSTVTAQNVYPVYFKVVDPTYSNSYYGEIVTGSGGSVLTLRSGVDAGFGFISSPYVSLRAANNDEYVNLGPAGLQFFGSGGGSLSTISEIDFADGTVMMSTSGFGGGSAGVTVYPATATIQAAHGLTIAQGQTLDMGLPLKMSLISDASGNLIWVQNNSTSLTVQGSGYTSLVLNPRGGINKIGTIDGGNGTFMTVDDSSQTIALYASTVQITGQTITKLLTSYNGIYAGTAPTRASILFSTGDFVSSLINIQGGTEGGVRIGAEGQQVVNVQSDALITFAGKYLELGGALCSSPGGDCLAYGSGTSISGDGGIGIGNGAFVPSDYATVIRAGSVGSTTDSGVGTLTLDAQNGIFTGPVTFTMGGLLYMNNNNIDFGTAGAIGTPDSSGPVLTFTNGAGASLAVNNGMEFSIQGSGVYSFRSNPYGHLTSIGDSDAGDNGVAYYVDNLTEPYHRWTALGRTLFTVTPSSSNFWGINTADDSTVQMIFDPVNGGDDNSGPGFLRVEAESNFSVNGVGNLMMFGLRDRNTGAPYMMLWNEDGFGTRQDFVILGIRPGTGGFLQNGGTLTSRLRIEANGGGLGDLQFQNAFIEGYTNFTGSSTFTGVSRHIGYTDFTANLRAAGIRSSSYLVADGTSTFTGFVTFGANLKAAGIRSSTYLQVDTTMSVTGQADLANFTASGWGITGGSFTVRSTFSVVGASACFNSQCYSWPSAVGSANQTLTTDGNRNLSWATPSAGTGSSIYPTTSTARMEQFGLSGGTATFTTVTITSATILTPLLKGTTTNDSACPGCYGQTTSSTAIQGATAASGVYGNIAQVSISTGDWTCYGSCDTTLNGASVSGAYYCAVSTFSGNTTTDHITGSNVMSDNPSSSITDGSATVVWYSLKNQSYTVYLKQVANFITGGPPLVSGEIKCRRER